MRIAWEICKDRKLLKQLEETNQELSLEMDKVVDHLTDKLKDELSDTEEFQQEVAQEDDGNNPDLIQLTQTLREINDASITTSWIISGKDWT